MSGSAADLVRAAHSVCAAVIRKLSAQKLRLIVIGLCAVFWLLVIGFVFL